MVRWPNSMEVGFRRADSETSMVPDLNVLGKTLYKSYYFLDLFPLPSALWQKVSVIFPYLLSFQKSTGCLQVLF